MINCASCEKQIADAARFCPYCGSQMAVVKSAGDDPYLGKLVNDKYLVEEMIGEGGMGRVYRAVQQPLDKIVVLKVLRSAFRDDASLVARFQREARAASRLSHPNVIQVTDFGQIEDGSVYITMEYLEGKNLGMEISEKGPFEEERLAHVMKQVLSALSEAHSKSVIHRDLKPENIMLVPRRDNPDHVKVLDFGIAKIKDREGGADAAALTQAGLVCGTPEYMSPEQAKGEELDARSDIYAVGVLMYQLATGVLPFQGDSSVGIFTKHITEAPKPPRMVLPSISPELESVILKCMAKKREDRFSSAEELYEKLSLITTGTGQVEGDKGPQSESSMPVTDDQAGEVPAPVTGQQYPHPVTGDRLYSDSSASMTAPSGSSIEQAPPPGPPPGPPPPEGYPPQAPHASGHPPPPAVSPPLAGGPPPPADLPHLTGGPPPVEGSPRSPHDSGPQDSVHFTGSFEEGGSGEYRGYPTGQEMPPDPFAVPGGASTYPGHPQGGGAINYAHSSQSGMSAHPPSKGKGLIIAIIAGLVLIVPAGAAVAYFVKSGKLGLFGSDADGTEIAGADDRGTPDQAADSEDALVREWLEAASGEAEDGDQAAEVSDDEAADDSEDVFAAGDDDFDWDEEDGESDADEDPSEDDSALAQAPPAAKTTAGAQTGKTTAKQTRPTSSRPQKTTGRPSASRPVPGRPGTTSGRDTKSSTGRAAVTGGRAPAGRDATGGAATAQEAARARSAASRGDQYWNQNNYANALRYYEQAAQINPQEPTYQRQIGLCHISLGRGERGAVHLRRYLNMAPNASDRRMIEDLIRQHGG